MQKYIVGVDIGGTTIKLAIFPVGERAIHTWGSLVTRLVKNLPAMRDTWVQFLGWKDPLEKGKATHSSFLAWNIPQSMWSQRVGHD